MKHRFAPHTQAVAIGDMLAQLASGPCAAVIDRLIGALQRELAEIRAELREAASWDEPKPAEEE